MIWKGAEASKLNTTAEDTPAEVKVQNESEELAPKEEKKKLNKRERKEARQQKNGKTKKGAENAPAVEHGEKVKKRKHASEEANGEENGDETSTKKRKKSKDCSEGKTMHMIVFVNDFCVYLIWIETQTSNIYDIFLFCAAQEH